MTGGRRALDQDDRLDKNQDKGPDSGDSRRSLSLESQERQGDKLPQKIYTDVPASTEVATRLSDKAVAIGQDGKREPNQPIRRVENFDAAGKSIGSSDYIYPRTNDGRVQMNGYIDRDAAGNIKEFAVRLPKLKNDESPVYQRDVFMVYRAKPGQPIDQESVNRVMGLLNVYKENGDKKTPAESIRDQNVYFQSGVLGGNMLRLRENQVIGVGLDPETGKRFTVRAQELSEKQETPAKLTWFEPGKPGQMIAVDKLSPADAAAIANASVHGNLRTPLTLELRYQEPRYKEPRDQQYQEQSQRRDGQRYDDPRYDQQGYDQQRYDEQRSGEQRYDRNGRPQQQQGQRYNGPLKR